MAREASTTATGGFVFQLKAKRQHEGKDTFEERLPIAKELEVDRFAPEIDGDGAVFTGLAGSVAHGHPSGIRSRKQRRYNGGNALKSQGHHEGLRGLPRKAMECGFYRLKLAVQHLPFTRHERRRLLLRQTPRTHAPLCRAGVLIPRGDKSRSVWGSHSGWPSDVALRGGGAVAPHRR